MEINLNLTQGIVIFAAIFGFLSGIESDINILKNKLNIKKEIGTVFIICIFMLLVGFYLQYIDGDFKNFQGAITEILLVKEWAFGTRLIVLSYFLISFTLGALVADFIFSAREK